MNITLQQFITRHFNSSELRALCAELGVNYDALVYPGGVYQGEGHAAKTHALVERAKRMNRMDELVQKVQARHPQAFQAAQVIIEPETIPDQEQESGGRDGWRWDVLHVGLAALAVALVATFVLTLVPLQGTEPVPSATLTPSDTPRPLDSPTPSTTPTPSSTPTPSDTKSSDAPTLEAPSDEGDLVDLAVCRLKGTDPWMI